MRGDELRQLQLSVAESREVFVRNLIGEKPVAFSWRLDPFGPLSNKAQKSDRFPPWLKTLEPSTLGCEAGRRPIGESRSDWCPCQQKTRIHIVGIAPRCRTRKRALIPSAQPTMF